MGKNSLFLKQKNEIVKILNRNLFKLIGKVIKRYSRKVNNDDNDL